MSFFGNRRTPTRGYPTILLRALHVVYSRVAPCERPWDQPSQLSSQSHSVWQRALSYAWWHAEIGADLAENAGLSERAVLYIRIHHEPHGPAAVLHRVDEVS